MIHEMRIIWNQLKRRKMFFFLSCLSKVEGIIATIWLCEMEGRKETELMDILENGDRIDNNMKRIMIN